MTALAAALPGFDGTASPLGLIASFGRAAGPIEIDRLAAAFPGLGQLSGAIAFRFAVADVSFEAQAERRAGRAVLTLAGDLGILPFTIENARGRRRLLRVVGAAQRATGIAWTITPDHRIRVGGEIAIDGPLTPAAMISAAVALLLRSQPYLDLVIAVAGEE